jgi:signal peptidase I
MKIKRLAVQFVIATVIALGVTSLDVVRVQSRSMLPGIEDGDWAIIIKTNSVIGGTFLSGRLRRQCIVVLVVSDKVFLKRVIGLPGDRVRIESGTVKLNEMNLKEPYADYSTAESRGHDIWPVGLVTKDVVVGTGRLFVLGDNRSESLDSRAWGTVEQSGVLGVVILTVRHGPRSE